MVAAPTVDALAQTTVSSTDTFTPRTWQPGTTTSTTTTVTYDDNGAARRGRSARRPLSTSTNIEEFEVTPRTTRRATRSGSRRTAALSSGDIVYDTPAPRFTQSQRPRRTRVASLGRIGLPSVSAPRPSLSGGGIAWRANSGCLAGNLRSLVASIASSHGSVTVNSTCRSASHNRRVGGASRSWHLTGNAVDFRVHGGNLARVSAYLRSNVGGFKHYGGGRYHIDNGPKRSF